jgi:hypothetical protein
MQHESAGLDSLIGVGSLGSTGAITTVKTDILCCRLPQPTTHVDGYSFMLYASPS